ncbi:ABC transporter related [Desulfofarcimen acetoxidans DSM 771]|uniref:ABC transporter related n=1 Tax=Desulfofarcimen acetoxidans (strain ATCC 49208 / DSM 771 / KCTC 5769 / VKM B-1644 / 5575) TaxID=485916 RepID=C8VXA7_DESAS|nr:ABC transporter ATP-binding protein [Desulfofarcimen acetoxidans]ACV64503.1 ABC transporter related [Desulfofarcimen acetoxidans DSM 771]
MSDKVREKVVYARYLVKSYDGFEAVKGVNMEVYRGNCLGLLGPNGAGKTSIVKMICGFSPVTSGKLEVFGENIMSRGRSIKGRIGVVPQEDNLDQELTVRQNLIVYASYFRMKKALALKRSDEILEFMDLTEKSREVVDNLSGGLKRRLTIGRALINNPELLILDEPTTGLDPYARHLVWQRLRKLKEAGTTILLTTHYLEEAEQLCDMLVVIYRGKVLEQGTPQELVDRHVGQEVLELGIASEHYDSLLNGCEEMVKGSQTLGDDVLLFTNHGRELSRLVSQKAAELGLTINYRRLRASNLEDVFLKLTGESLDEESSGNLQ